MNDAWIEMRIRIPAAGLDLVCSDLVELGCAGVTAEERPLDTFIPPDPDEAVTGDLFIKAFFPETPDIEELRRRIRDRLAWLARMIPGLEAELPVAVAVRNEDWAEGWKQHFKPVRIGARLLVKPSWESAAAAAGDVVIDIDPGMAFGTGTHGTTLLCLEALARLFEGPAPPDRVLDVGTGSGILSVAAAALGARRVLACDIDSEACRIAGENARLNGVSDRVEVTLQPLAELPPGFDAVLANILAEENIRLAPELVRCLAPGGVLILSGILRERESAVVRAFSRYPLSPPEISHSDEWSCLLYRTLA
jgi:ribosomal protein L11 methyltransferase